MKEHKNSCDPCEEKFEKGVKEIVNQVEGYTQKDRDSRKKEVEEAFPTEKVKR